jgi:hypothetical protein
MFRLPQIYIAHSVILWGMTTGIVGPMTLCTKDRGTYTRSKAKHNNKETLHSITPQEKEISIPSVDTEDEDKDEEWVKAKERSFVTTVCNQDTWKGIVRILALHAVIAARSTML